MPQSLPRNDAIIDLVLKLLFCIVKELERSTIYINSKSGESYAEFGMMA